MIYLFLNIINNKPDYFYQSVIWIKYVLALLNLMCLAYHMKDSDISDIK